jgi:hypothetical protein
MHWHFASRRDAEDSLTQTLPQQINGALLELSSTSGAHDETGRLHMGDGSLLGILMLRLLKQPGHAV